MNRLGSIFSWLNLVMVVITFLVVLLRYGFSLGWVWMQELVMYSHALVFLGCAGMALQRNAHVRVDLLYGTLSPDRKKTLDRLGFVLFLWPMLGLLAYESLPYIVDSWKSLEGSKDGGGLEAVFILKSFILVYVMGLFWESLRQMLGAAHD